MKICCVIGPLAEDFPWDYSTSSYTETYLEDINCAVEKFINEGFDYFICNGAVGVGMDFAETVLRFKEKRPNLKLEISIPYKNQEQKWSDEYKKRYSYILEKADYVNTLSEYFKPECMRNNDKYMINKSEFVYANFRQTRFEETSKSLQYAKTKKKKYMIDDMGSILSFQEDLIYWESIEKAKEKLYPEIPFSRLKNDQLDGICWYARHLRKNKH